MPSERWEVIVKKEGTFEDFQKTVVGDKEEVGPLAGVLNGSRKPELKLHRIGV